MEGLERSYFANPCFPIAPSVVHDFASLSGLAKSPLRKSRIVSRRRGAIGSTP